MKNTDASRGNPGYQLKGDLARLCLPEANRDADRNLAWVNSVCILFLIIGLVGARRGYIFIKPVPPLPSAVPVMVEPQILPPQQTVEKKAVADEKPDSPPVAVVLPQTPNINFSVPTIGSLVVPANLSVAPPIEPMHTAAQIQSVGSTGRGGDRPQPTYPKIALEEAEQGVVTLALTGDATGNVVSVTVKQSSGFSVLDHSAVEFVKSHWRLPAGGGNQYFETKITYRIQLN